MISQECKFSFFRVPSGPHSYCLDNFCQSSKQFALSLTWQLIINMHTINAVFLLVDTALNCLVSGSSSLLFISVHITSIFISQFHLDLIFPSSGSLGFESHTFSCGQPFMLFSNGSYTPVSRFGKLVSFLSLLSLQDYCF